MDDLGYIPVNGTVRYEFNTADRTGAAIAPSSAGSIRIYKDQGTTERASSSGVTYTPSFDSVTGCNIVSIDLSDNTTAGFYADGSQYAVMLNGATIDGVSSFNRFLFKFRIGTAPANTTQVAGSDVSGVNDFKASGFSTHSAADVWSVGTRALTDKAGFGLADGAITSAKVQDGFLTTAKLGSGFFDGVWSVAARTLTAFGFSVTASSVTDKTGYSLSADQSGVTIGTVNALGTQAKLDVNAEADTAISDAALATAANLAAAKTVVDAVKVTTDKLDDTLEDDAGTYRFTTNALEQAPTGGSAPTVGQIADEVETRTLNANIVSVTGTPVTDVDDFKANVSGLSTLTQANVRSAVGLAAANLDTQLADIPTVSELNARTVTSATYATASSLTTVGNNVSAVKAVTDKLDDTLENDGGAYRFNANALEEAPTDGVAPTAAAIADAVWDEDTTGHTTAGTFGAQAKTVLDGIATTLAGLAAATATAVWAAGARTLTAISDSSGITTLLSRLTEDRAGYLGKLNVPGTLANTDNADSFKADVTGMATGTDVTNAQTAITDAITVSEGNIRGGTETLESLNTAISTRSSHSAADVKAAMEATGSQLEQVHNTLASDGVFSTAALANAPASGAPPTVEAIADELEASDRFGGKFLTMIELDGAEYRYTENALEEGPGASLSGPYPLLVTVTDLATGDPIENARVRLYQSGVEESRDTNSSGQTQPALPALGTWGYAISAANHGSATGTVEIDGDPNPETLNVTLAQTTTITPPADPDLCLGYFTAIGADGQPESGAVFYAKLVEGDGTAGYSLDTSTESATSATDGLVQFPGLLRGKRYVFWRGTSHSGAKPFTIPDESTVAIPEFLGTP